MMRARLRSRRDFLRRGVAVSLPVLALGSVGVPLAACSRGVAAPARNRGAALASVLDWGARGDGTGDDTEAFQKAVDSLPASGGTVKVPAGDYRIDPTLGVQLRSRMHLELAPDATLFAIANAEPRAYVINAHRVEDVEVSGGRIVGDRHQHLNDEGEWGHGIMVRASRRVTVRDMHISDCWGDGMSIGGARNEEDEVIHSEDVAIANLVSTGNRRQGLTIGRSRHVRVRDSQFNHTSGTLPACGIDVEPDAGGTATDVVIEHCVMRANRGNGIQIYRRTSDVTVRDCLIEHNRGYGVLAIDTHGGLIAGNHIRGNGMKGIGLRGSTKGYELARNKVSENSLLFRDGVDTSRLPDTG